MCRYDKKIVYFHLMENGEKIGNAGFAKVIWQNGQMRLMTNVSGLHNIKSANCELLLLQGAREISLDSVFIKDGQCVYSRLYCGDELNKLGVCFEDAYGLCVNLDDKKKLMALWGEKRNVAPVEETAAAEECEVITEEEPIEEALPTEEMQFEEIQLREIVEQEDNPVEVRAEDISCLCTKGTERIHDDKWRQLEQIFSHIHPFGDKREYLSVEPKDYIVLTRDYQKLANNSFLLHGYYNYRHTILGKIPDQQGGTDQFYLGVPGVFYEREKAVALMFGFESFECAVEPAETGTFGYYMKRVEI